MTAPLRVVDTSAWIEWLAGSAAGKKPGKQIAYTQKCVVVPMDTGMPRTGNVPVAVEPL